MNSLALWFEVAIGAASLYFLSRYYLSHLARARSNRR